MAKPNYGFLKRQKEAAKKKKQDEKKKRKLAQKMEKQADESVTVDPNVEEQDQAEES